jgi:hypothetical protein
MKKVLIILILFLFSNCSSVYYMSGVPQHFVKIEYQKADKRFSQKKRKSKKYNRKIYYKFKGTQYFKKRNIIYKNRLYHKLYIRLNLGNL